jgi:hypothetical protein
MDRPKKQGWEGMDVKIRWSLDGGLVYRVPGELFLRHFFPTSFNTDGSEQNSTEELRLLSKFAVQKRGDLPEYHPAVLNNYLIAGTFTERDLLLD